MVSDLFFFLGLSLLLAHELDAIRCHEWRVLPLTAFLPDSIGYVVFTAAHIPLYMLLFWVLGEEVSSVTRTRVVIGLDLFFVVHLWLHVAFRKHPAYEFTSIFSWVLIIGTALCGLIDLLIRGM